ncbi:unnamed protein product [Closterium sp. Yama58-4]|nr:unnamed protein product [Closterium sp. Yama58-4]
MIEASLSELGEGASKGELGKEAGAGAGEVAVGEEGTGEEGVDDELVGGDGEEKEHGVGVLSSLISSYDPMAAVLLQSEVGGGVEDHTDEQKEKGEQDEKRERKEKREQKEKGEQREKRERKKGLTKENGGEEEEWGMTGECKAGRGMKTGGSTRKQEQSRKHKGQGTGKKESARKSRQGESRRLHEQTKMQQHLQQQEMQHQLQQETHAPSSPPSHAYQSVSPFYALVFEAPQKQSSRTPESHAPPSHTGHSVSPPYAPQLDSPEPQSPVTAIPSRTREGLSPPHAPLSHAPEFESPIPAIPTRSVSTSSIPARMPESRSPPSHAYQSASPPFAPLSHAPESIAPFPSSPVAPPTHPSHQSSTSGEPHSHHQILSHVHQSHSYQSHLYQPHPYQPIPSQPLALSHAHSTLSHSITTPSHAFTSHALTSHTVTAPTPSLLALRYVTALEERNRLSAAKLSQSALSVSLHAQHLAATDLSNHLMAQKVELSKVEKARREREGRERRGREELAGFARACADELVAGLLVMLVVIGATGWRFAGERLAAGVAACQVRHDPALDASSFLGVSFSRPDRSLVTWLRLIGCKLTVAGQMLLAFLVASATTYIMLLNNVAAATGAGSAHSRPATTIVLCLGCVCGYFGFYAVRLAGGDAVVWLVCWEALCVLHALVAWRKEQLFRMLYGRRAGEEVEEVGKLGMGADGKGDRRGGIGESCAGDTTGRPREHSGNNGDADYRGGSGRGSKRDVGWKGLGIGKMVGGVWRRMAEIVTAVMDDDVDGLVMGRWWAANGPGSVGRSASRRSSSSSVSNPAENVIRFIGALFSEAWMMAAGWVWQWEAREQERGWDGLNGQGYGHVGMGAESFTAAGASPEAGGGGMARYWEDDL